MNSAGVTPQSLQQKWQFAVELAGMDPKFFQKVDFPEFEFDEVEFNPAGSLFPQKAAGRLKFSDVSVEKAVPQESPEDALLNWLKQCVTVSAATGGVPADYMKDVDLVKYDRTGVEIKRYRLFNAWVKTGKFGEGEGGSSDNDIESFSLTYQYFEKV